MKTTKHQRITSAILALLMILTMLPLGAVTLGAASLKTANYLGRGYNFLEDKLCKSSLINTSNIFISDAFSSEGAITSASMTNSEYSYAYITDYDSYLKKQSSSFKLTTEASVNYSGASASIKASLGSEQTDTWNGSTKREYAVFKFTAFAGKYALNDRNLNSVNIKEEILAADFKNDVKNLSNENVEEFVQKYGTHILTAFCVGGQVTSTLIRDTKISGWESDQKENMEISASAGYNDIAKASRSINAENNSHSESGSETNTTNWFVYKFGFTGYPTTNDTGFFTSESLTELQNSLTEETGDILLTEDMGWVGIWELLETVGKNTGNNAYSDAGLLLKEYFEENTSADWKNDPNTVIISSAEELNEKVRNDLDGTYVLASNIDLSGYTNWQPIGTEQAPFSGKFYGNENEISGLTITGATNGYAGLFGCNTGSIMDLSVKGTISAVADANTYIGAIAGYNKGILKNCNDDVVYHVDYFSVASLNLPLRDVALKTNSPIEVGGDEVGVRIIGTEGSTYSGVKVTVAERTEKNADKTNDEDTTPTTPAYIVLENVNLTASQIENKTSRPIYIISTGAANSITAEAGKAAVSAEAANVFIFGDAALTIKGGEGKNGESAGADGEDGGIGIAANQLTVDINATLSVYGGKGGDGADGANGGKGGNGGGGGSAIQCTHIALIDAGVFSEIKGGSGGNGGIGANGASGEKGWERAWVWQGSAGNGTDGACGGVGGNAGNGGNAVSGNVSTNIFVSIVGGAAGTAGKGGNGGDGGDGGNNIAWGGGTGNGGNGGAGGNGGDGGKGGSAISGSLVASMVYNGASNGIGSVIGYGGIGGNKGYAGKANNMCGGGGSDGSNGSDGFGLKSEITYNNHRYLLMSGHKSWTEANAFAESIGGHLATVTSAAENAVLKQMVIDSGYSAVRLGAEDTSGAWKWVTGEAFSYTCWADGEPDHEEDEHYLGYWQNENNNWNDFADYSARVVGFLVEIETPSETTANEPQGETTIDSAPILSGILCGKNKGGENPGTVESINEPAWDNAHRLIVNKVTKVEYEGYIEGAVGNKLDKSTVVLSQDGLENVDSYAANVKNICSAQSERVSYIYVAREGAVRYIPIHVTRSEVTSVKVVETSIPQKIFYFEQAFNSSGLKLKLIYNKNENECREITEGFTISAPDLSTEGTKTVTVSYDAGNGKTLEATYEIEVLPLEVTRIFRKALPNQRTYKQGDGFNVVGLKIAAEYNDGTTEDIDVSELHFTIHDYSYKQGQLLCLAGENQTVVAEWCGYTVEYTINVSANDKSTHHFVDYKTVDPATHLKEGKQEGTCEYCGTVDTKVIPKLTEHIFGDWKNYDENQHAHSCECGKTEYAAHTWDVGKISREATHTVAGEKVYTCTICGATKTEAIDPNPLPHTFGAWTSVDETNHKRTCACGETETSAHTWGSSSSTAATADQEGSVLYICTVCGKTKTEIIPKLPALDAKTDSSITLKRISGYEYSIDGTTWQDSPVFTGLNANTEYVFLQRIKNAKDAIVSEGRFVTSKRTPNKPSAPTLSAKIDTVITLTAISGMEYKCGESGTWQTSNVFGKLNANQAYTFYMRSAETDSAYASAASDPLTVTTAKTTISGTVSISGDAKIGSKLVASVVAITPASANISYQWYADGVAISGETKSEYTVAQSNAGKGITVKVTGEGSYTGLIESNKITIQKEINPNDPQIVGESKNAYAGKEIEIPILFKNNPGISYLSIRIAFAGEVFTYENVTNGSIVTSMTSSMSTNPLTLIWSDSIDISEDGTLAILKLKVGENVAAGDYKIAISVIECNNADENDVTVYAVPMTVNVIDFVYGDANGDGEINGKDVTRLLKYLANYDYDTNTSTVEVSAGADATGDGEINGKDVTRLLKYLANYNYDTNTSTIILGK